MYNYIHAIFELLSMNNNQKHWAISKTRNNETPEKHHSGTQKTGTLIILNLLKIRKKITGGGSG
jgi:hypothetical protein